MVLFILKSDGAWETDGVVMETELILGEDVCVLIGEFIGCLGKRGCCVHKGVF